MVFVTVGTHEQPFNRLIEYIDDLKGKEKIVDQVVMQTGFSTYLPRHCLWSKLFSYQEMEHYVSKARVVITHGGPASIIMPLRMGKKPIVVPRQKQFGEHVNNHQMEFVNKISSKLNIIPIYEIGTLANSLSRYENISQEKETRSNNMQFNRKLEELLQNI